MFHFLNMFVLLLQWYHNIPFTNKFQIIRQQFNNLIILYQFQYLPNGTVVANKLNIPLTIIDPAANHLLPHTSNTMVRNVSAGNSVALAMVKVRKTSSPKVSTFLTCPSNTNEIAIHSTISTVVIFLKRGVLNKSRTV